MVFNPTSPIRALGRKAVVVVRSNPPQSEAGSVDQMSNTAPSESASPKPAPLRSWRGGLTNLLGTHERHSLPREASRWSKTTTETEGAESNPALQSKPLGLLRKANRRRSNVTTNSSPVDPAYDPVTQNLRVPAQNHFPGAETGPDEPRSFLESDSSDDETESSSPVVQRASSVRVSRPMIVQHSNDSNGSVPKLVAPGVGKANSSTSLQHTITTEKGLNHNLPPAIQETLQVLEGQSPKQSSDTAFPPGPAERRGAILSSTTNAATTDRPDTPTRLEALDTLSTPHPGFGLQSFVFPRATVNSNTPSEGTTLSPSIDGLRSNPTSESDKKLLRTISAPARGSEYPRKVVIRPADLVISKDPHSHSAFRESIVSTPYPARQCSIGEIPEPDVEKPMSYSTTHRLRRSKPLDHKRVSSLDGALNFDGAHNASNGIQSKVFADTNDSGKQFNVAKSDRFPSPHEPDILFLSLRLARHPHATIELEIEVTDTTTFDDEQLFNYINSVYNTKLLGFARRVCSARKLSDVSLSFEGARDELGLGPVRTLAATKRAHHHGTSGGRSEELDGTGFVAHLHNPLLGRHQKTWLLWLRQTQELSAPVASRRTTPTSPAFSFDAGATSHSPTTMQGNRRSMPRMPFGVSPYRAKPVLLSPPHDVAFEKRGPPSITLHHRFSMLRVTLALLLTLLVSAVAAVFWILFGVPGRTAAMGDGWTSVEGKDYRLSWARDAQGRVGTGLVLGGVLFCVGVALDAAWIWGSWVLL